MHCQAASPGQPSIFVRGTCWAGGCQTRQMASMLLIFSAFCLQVIVLLVIEGQQMSLREPPRLSQYHSLEMFNCSTVLGRARLLGRRQWQHL